MKRLSSTALTALVIGCLLLLNLLAVRHFFRLDLTQEGVFTLAPPTIETLDGLQDPVTITAYFSDELPPPFSAHARYVRDLLEEYRAASRGRVSFEFVDPATAGEAGTEPGKRDLFGRAVRTPTSVEQELAGLGIEPVELRVIEQDQAQTRRAYLGLAVRYGERREVIPVVQSTETLEYDLTTLLRQLTRPKRPIVGLLQGHGEPLAATDLQRLVTMLEQNYDVRPIAPPPNDVLVLPPELDALLVIGPEKAQLPESVEAIDAFLLQGKSAAFFVDRVAVDWKSLKPSPVKHGLDELLAAYGFTVGEEVVGDAECATLQVQERRGPMVVQVPLRYPFLPLVRRLAPGQPLTRGVEQLPLPFASPVTTTAREGVEYLTVVHSSQRSFLEAPTAGALDPTRDFGAEQLALDGPFPLVVQAHGVLPSFAKPGEKGTAESRLVVVGTSALFDPPMLGPPTATFLLNVVDWLLLDPQLLTMRARGAAAPPLRGDLGDPTRTAVKLGNVVGAPLLLLLFGLVRWRLREARRRRLQAAS